MFGFFESGHFSQVLLYVFLTDTFLLQLAHALCMRLALEDQGLLEALAKRLLYIVELCQKRSGDIELLHRIKLKVEIF